MTSLKLCVATLEEFKLLLKWKCVTQAPLLLIVDGRWNLMKYNSYDKLSEQLLIEKQNYDCPNRIGYLLITEGNDEIEDYIIETLKISKLPSIVTQTIGTTHQSDDRRDFFSKSLSTQNPLQVFISGDKSNVGKSSVCLSILASLLCEGISPNDIAYIKPVTQCEAEQPITRFCKFLGITERSIGPVVFYAGFTRAFLNQETDDSATLLTSVQDAVKSISKNKKFILVDGVGYPSVGSICGVSNGEVAQTLRIPVILIGK